MMTRVAAGILASGLLLAVAGAAGAANNSNDAGSTSGAMLRLGSGAVGPAMGDAYTAGARGVSSLYYNPGGLGFTDRAEVEAMYQRLVLDIGQGQVGFVHPVNSQMTWGLGLSYLDYGRTQRVTLSDVINSNIPSTSFSGQDILVTGALGRQFNDNFSVGVAAKVFHQEIDNIAATAVAADIGLSARFDNLPIRFGVAGRNLGTKLKFERVSEELPALVRGGLAVDLFNNRFTLNADLEKVRNQDLSFGVGAEVRVIEMLALRVGYDDRNDAGEGLTAGMGVRVSDLAFDYAYVPYGDFGQNHRVSLTYRFGPTY